MSGERARRGRPKGTGRNDDADLKSIKRLLDADPLLKPTTAIKTLGITDPSAIRRLRDKLRSSMPDSGPSIPHGDGADGEVCNLLLAGAEINSTSARRHSHRYVQSSSLASEEAASHEDDDRFQWLAAWFGAGINALAQTLEMHLWAFETLIASPQIALALRQHIEFNEYAKVLCFPASSVPTTLH